jgi:hypothetical protein
MSLANALQRFDHNREHVVTVCPELLEPIAARADRGLARQNTRKRNSKARIRATKVMGSDQGSRPVRGQSAEYGEIGIPRVVRRSAHLQPATLGEGGEQLNPLARQICGSAGIEQDARVELAEHDPAALEAAGFGGREVEAGESQVGERNVRGASASQQSSDGLPQRRIGMFVE